MAGSRLTPLALGGTAVLWATAFPAIKVALEDYGPFGLSFLRLLVASVVLLLVAPLLGVRRPRMADLPLIVVSGVVMCAYPVLLNWGEVHVPAGTASLIVAVAPVFSVLMAAGFLGEPFTVRIGVGSVVAVGGSALIAVAGGNAGYTTAAWIVLGAAAVQGTYHVATKPLLGRYSALEVASYATWVGTVLVAPLGPAAVVSLGSATAAATISVVFLGVLPSALGFVLWGYGVARSSMSSSTAVLYLVPVLALVVSLVWLDEVPTPVELIGGLVSIAGVMVIRGRATVNHRPLSLCSR